MNPKQPRRAHAGSFGMAVPSAWQRKIEGTLRGYALRRGLLVDTYAMARLRDRAQISR